jgi:hypothetical protein
MSSVPGTNVVLDGTSTAAGTVGLRMGDGDNVNIRGFEIKNFPNRGLDTTHTDTVPEGGSVRDCIIDNCGDEGVGNVSVKRRNFLFSDVLNLNAFYDAFNMDGSTSRVTFRNVIAGYYGRDATQGDWLQISKQSPRSLLPEYLCLDGCLIFKENDIKHGILAYGNESFECIIKNCLFLWNATTQQRALSLGEGLDLCIKNNVFLGDWGGGVYAGIISGSGSVGWDGDVLIQNNYFQDKTTSNLPCIEFGEDSSASPIITKNTFVNCRNPLKVDHGGGSTIERNIWSDTDNYLMELPNFTEAGRSLDHNSYDLTNAPFWKVVGQSNTTTLANWRTNSGDEANSVETTSPTFRKIWGYPQATASLLTDAPTWNEASLRSLHANRNPAWWHAYRKIRRGKGSSGKRSVQAA